MKKFVITTLVILIAISGLSQNRYDALRYSTEYYQGTARSMSMGNAMTALGGDLGAITLNPAASGIFLHSEFTLTPSLFTSFVDTDYLDNKDQTNRTHFGLANIGWVLSLPIKSLSEIKNINFAIVANNTNDFTYKNYAHGTETLSSFLGAEASSISPDVTGYPNIKGYNLTMTDDYPNRPYDNGIAPWSSILGWNSFMLDTLASSDHRFIGATQNIDSNGDYVLGGPLDQFYSRSISGYNTNITLNTSINILDKLFIGANLSIIDIYYHSSSSYSEKAKNIANFDTGFEEFTYNQLLTTTATGIKLSAGVIYFPIKGLRIGASVSTPTWLNLKDNWKNSMSSRIQNQDFNVTSPSGEYEYRVTSPFKYEIGLAYILGKRAIISLDYEGLDYSEIKMKGDKSININPFESENDDISKDFQHVNNFRSGLEFRATPNFSIRAGYAYYEQTDKTYDDSKQFGTIGIGYKTNNAFFIDLAYMYQLNKQNELYTLYSGYAAENETTGQSAQYISVPTLYESSRFQKILLTLGFRF
ncbi:MAG: outer membrane protein transport protein [Bacteroidales bacterium]